MLGLVGALGFALSVDTQPGGELQDQDGDDSGQHARVQQYRSGTDRLTPQLIPAAAVEQTRDRGGRLLGGEEADQQRADDAADEVDTDDVE